MYFRPLIAFVALSLPLAGSAQSQGKNVGAERKLMTAEATAAFRVGDSTGAIAKLEGGIKHGAGAPHDDLQLARLLVPVAFALKNANEHARAAEASNLLLGKLTQAERRMSAKDAAGSYNLAGQIYEWRGDDGQALGAYQQALALDPTLRHARERVTHLQAEAQILQSRTAANAMLQQRNQPKR
jgi:tetratricopeptide (TPR) repeat protein